MPKPSDSPPFPGSRLRPWAPSGLLALLALLAACGATRTPEEDGETDGAGPVPGLAIVGARVVPGTGAGPLSDATVLVEGDRIVAVGPRAEVRIPDHARRIEAAGRTLIPGLFDMHVHLSKARASSLGLFVANGVTTVRDVGGDHHELLDWRREVRAGERLGPRILLAGPYLESLDNVERMRADPPGARAEPFERTRVPVGSPAEARRIVDSLAALELDFLKVRTVQDRATYLALNEAADAHGLDLVGHTFGIPAEVVLEAGQDAVEHSLYPTLDSLPREVRAQLWRRFAERGVAVVPTLVTFARSVALPTDSLRAIVDDSLGRIDPRRRYVSRFLVLDWHEQVEEASEEMRELLGDVYRSTLRNLREMREAGVRILPGSDVAVVNIFPGSSLHDELALFVEELGMTPAEAIGAATRRSAEFLGIADSVGIVEPGRVADLVLLDGDPLDDIRATRSIHAVVLRGRFLGPEDLERLRARVRAAHDLRENDWR